MKRISLILVLTFISTNCIVLSAQITKGRFLLGEFSYIEFYGNGVLRSTNLGYTTFQTKSDGSNDDEKDKLFSFNIVPRVGYFIIDNLAIGLDVYLAKEKVKSGEIDHTYNSTFFAIGPFVRYYIPMEKVLPFAEVNYSIGSRSGKSEYSGSETTHNYAIKLYGAGLGVAIPIGDKVSFDALAGYNVYVNKDKEDNDNNERLIAGTIGLNLGFSVLLGSN